MSNIWPKADDYDERTALASVIWSYQPPSLTAPITGPQSIAMAASIIDAGWGNLERFRHDVTNTLGMAMVHEADDPDLGYDRGIVDAMDVVNGAAHEPKRLPPETVASLYEGYGKGGWGYDSGGVVPATDIHACAKCGHTARQHPVPGHCEWWTDSTRTDPRKGDPEAHIQHGGAL